MELYEWLAIAGTGLVAGIVNTLVGGGSSIVLPLLIYLNFDPLIANGTNRLCVAFQAGAAAKTFRGKTGATRREMMVPVTLAVLGAVPGALLASILDPALFEKLLGWILLAGVILFFAPPRTESESRSTLGEDSNGVSAGRALPPFGLVMTFFFGVYGGFVGAGIGVLMLLYLPSLLRLPLVQMVEVKVWMVFALSAAAGLVYIVRGQVDLEVMLALLPTYVAGGVIGAKLTLRGGERWARRAIAVVAALLAIAIITGVKR